MKGKFTPGPWRAVPRGADCNWHINIIPAGGSKSIANVIDFGCKTQVNQYVDENPEQNANARLIAQAPALLEMCQEALAWITDSFRPEDQPINLVREMRDIIAQATGDNQ